MSRKQETDGEVCQQSSEMTSFLCVMVAFVAAKVKTLRGSFYFLLDNVE